jgi:hypothetical protein
MTKPEKERRMPKTVRPKEVVIGDKLYDKCPYQGCGHMVEVMGSNAKSGLRPIKLPSPDDIYGHIRKEHGMVWMSIGKHAGWHRLSKFHHPKLEESKQG